MQRQKCFFTIILMLHKFKHHIEVCNKMKFYKLIILASSFLISGIAMAGLIVPAPNNVDNPLHVDSLESDEYIYMFTEQQNYTLQSALLVDQLIDSSNTTLDSTPILGELSANTAINSYLFHFDAETANITPPEVDGKQAPDYRSIQGTHVFDSTILAVIWSGLTGGDSDRNYLSQSDYLAAPQQYYSPDSEGLGRGLEPSTEVYLNAGTQDYFLIAPDLKTITFDFRVVPIFADQIRVITATKVPEPTTLWLFAAATICLLNVRRFS